MLYNNSMESMKSRASLWMDALFRTGYPHPINAFAALLLALIPLLSPFTGGLSARPTLNHGLAGLVGLLYLVIWSRLRVFVPGRPTRFFWLYIIAQTWLV
ncbi:MAG TPA: hypothetical protein VK464_03405, partial [Symbiobacteriaceae bacterium]|nr:hypothetical protein [Symbiobacteriaceae bacterium]